MAKRKKSKDIIEASILVDLVVKGMQEKKAHNIKIIDLRNLKSAFADYFVIATGNSDTQVDAIGDSVEEVVYKTMQHSPFHKEGKENREWILIDYIDVVAHVFSKEKRAFFALEELWGDGEITDVPDEQ